MKLLHRLLATAGLAALLGPHPAAAAAVAGPEAKGPLAPAVGQLDRAPLDDILAQVLAGLPAEPAALAAALPDVTARMVAAAPAGTRPEEVATRLSQGVLTVLAQNGAALDVATRANLASEIVAALEREFAAAGVRIDRVAVAAAALGGMSHSAGQPAAPLDRYTAATSPSHVSARDVGTGTDHGRNSAY